MRFLYQLHEIYYYCKCFLFKKYNRVIIRTLPPTWNDRDRLLEHAIFQILSDFFEKEKPLNHFDVENSEDNKWRELVELNDWWHNVYLKFDSWAGWDDIEHPKRQICDQNGRYIYTSTKEETEFTKKSMEKEETMRKELTAKMHRLVELRGMLWT